jgi:sugar/nucleoside kinase (ribokinase family)
MIFNGVTVEYLPAVEIECIDANGAGDIFRGAFGYGVLKNWSIRQTIEYANIVAGLQCTRYGNGTAIPYPREIDEFSKIAKIKRFQKEHVDKMFGK